MPPTHFTLPLLLLFVILLTTTTASIPSLSISQHDAHLLTTSQNFLPQFRRFPGSGFFGGLFGGGKSEDAVSSGEPAPEGEESKDDEKDEKEEEIANPSPVESSAAAAASPVSEVNVNEANTGGVASPSAADELLDAGEDEEDEDKAVKESAMPVPTVGEEDLMTAASTPAVVVEEASSPSPQVSPTSSSLFGFATPSEEDKKKNVFGMPKSESMDGLKGDKGFFGMSSVVIVAGIGAVAATLVIVGGVWAVIRRRRLRNEGFEDMRRSEPGVYRADGAEEDGVFEIGDDRA